MKYLQRMMFLLVIVYSSSMAPPATADSGSRRAEDASALRKVDSPVTLPLVFEENRGQFDRRTKFVARNGKGTFHFRNDEAALIVSPGEHAGAAYPVVFRMRFSGAPGTATVVGEGALSGRSHYFRGADPTKWIADVRHYARIRQIEVYPGIDVVYRHESQRLEHDFIVAPGSDPRAIVMTFPDASNVEIDEGGDLVLRSAVGVLIHKRPKAFQVMADKKVSVASRFVALGGGRIGLSVARFDRASPLVIDPSWGFSTYLGGAGDDTLRAVAADSSGNVYTVGTSYSANYPTSLGAHDVALSGTADVVITKLNSSGSAIVYSSFLGGSGNDWGFGVRFDNSNNVYVAGQTTSSNFPTANAFDTTLGGGSDAFLTKLNASGSALLYSTYLGGGNQDFASSLIVDRVSGDAFVAGGTLSGDFPLTPGVHQPYSNGGYDGFVTKLRPTSVGSASLIWSSYLGGSGEEVAWSIALLDGQPSVCGYTSSNDLYTTLGAYDSTYNNQEAFAAVFNSAGTDLTYATYLGGEGDDGANAIAATADGMLVVGGWTISSSFPTTSGAYDRSYNDNQDAFVAKLNPTMSGMGSLVWSTYFGGNNLDVINSIRPDSSNNVYVTGATNSNNLPMLSPLQPSYGNNRDAFVAKLAANGSSLIWSSYLGGSGFDTGWGIAVNAAGAVYVAGATSSSNFPVQVGSYDQTYNGSGDGFLAHIF